MSGGETSSADDAAAEEEAASASGPGTAVELLLPTDQPSNGPVGALRNARALWSPVGSVVVFGGYGVLDSFQPPL
jgi:hypothetical protein